jgi:Winged helix Storkhead-box1 domain
MARRDFSGWLKSQPRITQIYCAVIHDLNSDGIFPGGRSIKKWIVDQFKEVPSPSKQEVETVLMALIAEKVISQADVDKIYAKQQEAIPRGVLPAQ